MSTAVRRVAVGTGVLAGVAGLAAAAVTALATYFTRRVLTPDYAKPDDVQVLALDLTGSPPTITLAPTDETRAPGRYGVWWGGRETHARVGEVVGATADRVVRELLGVDHGTPRTGAARWNQYHYAGDPSAALGLAFEDVEVPTEIGPEPAWFVPVADHVTTGTWAVLVHGRGASREECLRAVPPLHSLGLPVLVPSYRNDVGAPIDPSGRYHLGDQEWRDVEAAVRWAVQRGARDVVLVGWSMGGAIVLQAATRSEVAHLVRAVVLDGPVIDWHSVLDHHATLNRVPTQVGRIGHTMMRHPLGRRMIGLKHPLDLRRLDWVARAAELSLPVLLIHSDGDEYVPNGPSARLAAARPDVVQMVPWQVGRHTKEWNTDPARWDDVVATWLRGRLDDDLAVRRAPTG
jgi:pimeloyl-ACP methyl ester carboxylesterase